MAPKGLAIIIGAGPTSGGGIARYLANQGNLAVAVLARNPENLNGVVEKIRSTNKSAIVEAFPTDTSVSQLQTTFNKIAKHDSFKGLKLKLAIYHIKQSAKEPFLDTKPEEFSKSMETYVTGALTFAQESVRLMYSQNGGQTLLADTNGEKKGTIIFTGTLGALRTNAEYTSYGATRSAARSVAQALAKGESKYGIHAVHAIANGPIRDEDSEATRTGASMSADIVAAEHLHLMDQSPALWTHELDLRPAQEKF